MSPRRYYLAIVSVVLIFYLIATFTFFSDKIFPTQEGNDSHSPTQAEFQHYEDLRRIEEQLELDPVESELFMKPRPKQREIEVSHDDYVPFEMRNPGEHKVLGQDDHTVPIPAPPSSVPEPTPNSFALVSNDYKVTAVILNWKRPNNLKVVLARLLNHQFVGEVIVWNNNKDMTLSVDMFQEVVDEHIENNKYLYVGDAKKRFSNNFVRVVNAPNNLHDFAKHLACSMAKYDSCYFQDDDWDNHFIKSLFYLHRKYPNVIVSNTMAVIHLEHRRWSMTDNSIGLHTGFTWLGCGSFFTKEKSNRFIRQLTSLREIEQEDYLLADMFFAIWNNEYPYQLENPLFPLNQTGAWSAREDQWNIVYKNLHRAATILAKYLQDPTQNLFSTAPSYPALKHRNARAPCHTDECLFTTDMYAFPAPESVVFDPSLTVKEQEAKFNALSFPDSRFWVSDAYHYAVDDNADTCWRSWHPIKKGSFFGLDLLAPKEIVNINLILKKDEYKFVDHMSVMVSSDELSWTDVGFSAVITGERNLQLQLYTAQPFQFVRFQSQADLDDNHFVVCELSYETKRL